MNAKEIIRTMELNPDWRIQRGAGESKWMLCHKDTIAPGFEWVISDRSFNALKKQNRFVRDDVTEAQFKAYGVDVTVYMLASASTPADEPTDDIGTMTEDTVAARAIAEAEAGTPGLPDPDDEPGVIELFRKAVETPALAWIMGIDVDKARAVLEELDAIDAISASDPGSAGLAAARQEACATSGAFAVGDRVEVIECKSDPCLVGDTSTISGVDGNTYTLDNGHWFFADELRKLDTPDPLAAAQAEIARLQAEVNRLAACDTMLTQGLADVFSKHGAIYHFDTSAVAQVDMLLMLKRENINAVRRLLADADMCAPATCQRLRTTVSGGRLKRSVNTVICTT